MKRVITGFTTKGNGILFVSDKSLQEIAGLLAMFHIELDGQHYFNCNYDFTEDDLRDISNGEIPRYAYAVYVATYEEDKNLSSAVCW